MSLLMQSGGAGWCIFKLTGQPLILLVFTFFLVLAAWAGDEQASRIAADRTAISGKESAVAQLGVAPRYKGDIPSLSALNVRDAKLERVLPPIKYPWAFEFLNDEEILLTQNSGRILKINLRTKERRAIRGLPSIGTGFTQIGLMDIAIHPEFSSNGRIYFSYARPDSETGKYHVTEVATGVLVGNALRQQKTLLNSEDFGWAPANFGGALAFDDDLHLYITIGDRGEDMLTRRGDRLEGKVLRINADGTVPADNPFLGQEGFDPRIYALGVRNSQGLYFDSPSNTLFESEHGPLGGDEINIIRPGQDYGWPTISYGNNYSTTKPIGLGTHKEGMEQPIFYFLPSIAISPLAVYRGDMFKEWEGDILIGALKGQQLTKLDFDMGLVRSSQSMLAEVGGRIRDIKVAKDGSIYILSQTTGLHRLYRSSKDSGVNTAKQGHLVASEVAVNGTVTPVDAIHPGKTYYDLVCSGCHNSGASGAPVLGNYQQWKAIMAQPLDLTREHVLNGYRGMPERGLCYACSDDGLMQMVDYMFVEANINWAADTGKQ